MEGEESVDKEALYDEKCKDKIRSRVVEKGYQAMRLGSSEDERTLIGRQNESLRYGRLRVVSTRIQIRFWSMTESVNH